MPLVRFLAFSPTSRLQTQGSFGPATHSKLALALGLGSERDPRVSTRSAAPPLRLARLPHLP
jgi:hypothetical protein